MLLVFNLCFYVVVLATCCATTPHVLAHTTFPLQDLLESDIKFLVFAHHHNLLDGIEKAVNAAKASQLRKYRCPCVLLLFPYLHPEFDQKSQFLP